MSKPQIIVIAIGVLIIVIVAYFLFFRKPKTQESPSVVGGTGAGTGSVDNTGTHSKPGAGGSGGGINNSATSPTYTMADQQAKIGKTVYAAMDNVTSYRTDWSIYKTTQKGGWIGVVKGFMFGTKAYYHVEFGTEGKTGYVRIDQTTLK